MQPDPTLTSRTQASPPAPAAAPTTHSHVATGYASRTGRKLSIIAVVIALALLIGFLIVSYRESNREAALAARANDTAQEPPTVDVVSAESAPATESLVLPGETRAWYETTVYARVSGYVAKWSADIGDRVAKGQVLATIDTPELDDQLTAAKAKLKVSEAELKVQQSSAAFAKTAYDRWWNSPKGVVSEQEREEKKAEYDSSLARVAAAESQVNLNQADVESLSALTQFKEVTAPFDGIVTARRIDIGQLVTAGSTASTTSLYTIAQSDRIRVFVDVPESASGQMNPGTPVQIAADAFPGRNFSGVIAQSARAIDTVSKTMKVEVDITNPDLKLLSGMYVHANFQLKQSGLIQVPASALVFRSAGPQVAVVDSDGKVTFHAVTIARDQGDVVDLSSGLEAGQNVAMNIGDQISDGDRVAVNRAANVASAPSPTSAPVVAADVAPEKDPR